jgi:hypothetical protein
MCYIGRFHCVCEEGLSNLEYLLIILCTHTVVFDDYMQTKE